MLYSIRGTIVSKGDNYLIVSIGAVSVKVLTHQTVLSSNKRKGSEVLLYCHLYIRDNHMELYGFTDSQALKLFEMFTKVSGIGPKTALAILDVDTIDRIVAAIIERRTDFLTRTSGIGKKTAARVILELQNKLHLPKTDEITETMDVDVDIEEALVKLGYARREVKEAIAQLGSEPKKLEERLRAALQRLS